MFRATNKAASARRISFLSVASRRRDRQQQRAGKAERSSTAGNETRKNLLDAVQFASRAKSRNGVVSSELSTVAVYKTCEMKHTLSHFFSVGVSVTLFRRISLLPLNWNENKIRPSGGETKSREVWWGGGEAIRCVAREDALAKGRNGCQSEALEGNIPREPYNLERSSSKVFR